MLDFLYYLCIFPLESAMRAVLQNAYGFTGSWGVSVLLLSAAVNIALIPFYHLAESWQEAEREAQKRMGPKLAEIRAAFKGREREMYIRALHRLHGYSPIFALRTSCGLLIQIPFFFAAYHLLHAAPQLAGSSWLFIHDLSKPDGLLSFGDLRINLLPFVMTGANLLSAAVYTSRLSRKDSVQLYVLAAVFLVLLYPASSALLLYWTSNNAISLLKNYVYTRFVYTDKKTAHPVKLAAAVSSRMPTGLPPNSAWRDAALMALSIAAFVAGLLLSKKAHMVQALSCGALSAASGACAMALRSRAIKAQSGIEKHLPFFALIVSCIVAIAVFKLTSFKKMDTPIAWWYFLLYATSIGLFTGWACSRPHLLTFCGKAASFCEARLNPPQARLLFGFAALLTAILVCWFTPAALYASDPDFFYESFAELAARLTWRGLMFLAAALLCYRLAHARLKPFLAAFMAWIAGAALLYTFAAAGDYGAMDDFLLTNPALLKTRLAFLVDIAVCSVAWLAIRQALQRGKAAALTTVLQGLCLALTAFSLWQIWGVPSAKAPDTNAAPLIKLPDYTDRFFGFSRESTNTVVIMFDMYTGSHTRAILEAEPELANALDGFVWYSDTIAPGSTTLLSIASILGGEKYTPPNINARQPASVQEEMHKGFAVLPDIFVPRGYDVAIGNVDHLIPENFAKACRAAPQTLLVGQSLNSAYTGYWRRKKNLAFAVPESRAPFLASVGLFRAAPWLLRQHIYYDGSWLNTQTVIHNPSEGPYALLDVLPEISNADAKGHTLKFFTSMLTHYPWRLDETNCMPAQGGKKNRLPDGSIAEHRIAERCALRALARWIAWMKQTGVYDNTQILIVSDHDGDDSTVYKEQFAPFHREGIPWKPDALLMVKSRGARGALRVSDLPMSSADVVPIICAENGPCPEAGPEANQDPRSDVAGKDTRVRSHSAGAASVRRHTTGAFIMNNFSITGAGANPDHWKALPPDLKNP